MAFDDVAGGSVRFVVVCDSRVWFNFADVCLVSSVVSCADDVISELREVLMWVVRMGLGYWYYL